MHWNIPCLTLKVLRRKEISISSREQEKLNLTIRCFFSGRGRTPLLPAFAPAIGVGRDFCCCGGTESSCSRFCPRGSSVVAGIGGRLPGWATAGFGVAARAGIGVDTECATEGVAAPLVGAEGVVTA